MAKYIIKKFVDIFNFNDAKTMASCMKRSLNDVRNPHVVKMLERFLRYNFKVKYRSANKWLLQIGGQDPHALTKQ